VKPSEPLPKSLRIADRIARVVVAVILIQTLRFKFTGAPESVYIFETVGHEPWGRYGSGVVELIASILLFVPGFAAIGALLAAGTMAGAIFFHLTTLGIEVMGDGGLLFGAALLVFTASLFVAWNHRRTLPVVGARF
jgi:putative oxidoreductase